MLASRLFSVLVGLVFQVVLVRGDVLEPARLPKRAIEPTPSNGHWIDTWASMPQLTEPSNLPPAPFNQTGAVFVNSTIRQTLHMSVGASQIRLKISNAFGVTNLPITAVSIALPLNNTAGIHQIQPSTLQKATFSGSDSISIPYGGLAVSDPLNFPIKPQSMLTVTIYLATGQTTNSITSHPGSRTTSWFQFGDAVSAPSFAVTNSTIQSAAHWYFISAIEAWVQPTYSTFAIIGDSITDGRGSDTNANNRWPDLLLSRLQANNSTSASGFDTRTVAIANQAAGGNQILPPGGLGPPAAARIERDVLSHPGVRYAMVFEGVNDIGGADPSPAVQDAVHNSLIQAYQQIVTRIHASGIPVFGATITPFSAPANFTGQPYSNPNREKTRQKVNQWIRGSGVFDAVVDFDKVVRDPDVQSRLKEEFDSGDYLHPNVRGYGAMAGAVDLGLFGEWKGGVGGFV